MELTVSQTLVRFKLHAGSRQTQHATARFAAHVAPGQVMKFCITALLDPGRGEAGVVGELALAH